MLKQTVFEFLNQAKKQRNDDEISSIRSRLSGRSKHSATSSCSSKTKLMEAKVEAAALEVKAAFLKERQALRMARPETASKWLHLQRVVKDIPPYMEDVEIGLLIGL